MAGQPNPYVPPGALLEPPEPTAAPASQRGYRAPILMAMSFGLAVVGAVIPRAGLIFFALATIAAVVGVVSGIVSLGRARGRSLGWRLGIILASVGNLAMTAIGALAALISLTGFSRGRQLRRFGRVILPPVEANQAWSGTSMQLGVPESARAGLAAAWRENARTEHASVAAFARLTLDLMALGAPPELVASANRDALDEIRHTELCFSLARALDGASQGPGPFPEPRRARTLSRIRTLALAQLAVDSLIDGALHEGVSARVIAKLARRCGEPAIRSVLKEIAADEGRHTAHGWDVVEWCLAEGGTSVAQALLGATGVLSRRPAPNSPRDDVADGSWERWGIHGQALAAEEYQAARDEITQRVLELTTRVLPPPGLPHGGPEAYFRSTYGTQ